MRNRPSSIVALTILIIAASLVLVGCGAKPMSPLPPSTQTLGELTEAGADGLVYEVVKPYAFLAPDESLRLFYAFEFESRSGAMITQVVAQERCFPSGRAVFDADGVLRTLHFENQLYVCQDLGTAGASKGGIADVAGEAMTAISLPAAAFLLGYNFPENVGDRNTFTNEQGQDQRQLMRSSASSRAHTSLPPPPPPPTRHPPRRFKGM